MHWTPMKPTFREPATCIPREPVRLCEHCSRRRVKVPDQRVSVVIDASTTLSRTDGCCGMFAFPPSWPLRGVA
jgi:hypothetical protein